MSIKSRLKRAERKSGGDKEPVTIIIRWEDGTSPDDPPGPARPGQPITRIIENRGDGARYIRLKWPEDD